MKISISKNQIKSGFTLVEMAIVLVIVGLLLGTGASLMNILTKRSKLIENREIVNKAYEAVIGFAVNNKRLPTQGEFQNLGIKTTDSQNQQIIYIPVSGFTTGNFCTKTATSLVINDNTNSTPINRNAVFIIFAIGENRCNETGTSSPFQIFPTSHKGACSSKPDSEYDDIVRYADINQLRQNNCNAFRIVTDSLPMGTEHESYPTTTLEATDGTPNYNWTLVSGSLPNGISLASNGAISGTPTVPGTFNFTVSATDSDNPQRTTTKSLSITINPNKPRITTEFLAYGTVGTTYPPTTLSVTGGKAPYTWTTLNSPPLPPGLSLNSSGQISGVPTSSGTYNFTATVSDSASPQNTETKNLSITINPSSNQTCNITATPSTINSGQNTRLNYVVYNIQPGSGTISFNPSSGSCPATSSVSPSGSTYSDSCQTASINNTTTFTFTYTDAGGRVSSCSTTVFVGPSTTAPPTCTLEANPNPVISGGQTTLIWSITNGPANGSFSSNGSLGTCSNFTNSYSGTCRTGVITLNPTEFTLTVTNSNGTSQCRTFAYIQTSGGGPICPAMSINTSWIPNASRQSNYPSTTLQPSGGISPFTWSWTGAPAGMTLNATTGVIGGRPNNDSLIGTTPFNITVTLRDSCSPQQIATRNYQIYVGRFNTYVVRNLRGAGQPYYILGGQYTTCTLRNNNTDFNVRNIDDTPVSIYTDSNCSIPAPLSSVNYRDVIGVDEAGNRDRLLSINASWNLVDR